MPDGRRTTGQLDAVGSIRIEGVKRGQCTISFSSNNFFVTKIGGKKPKAFGRSKSVYVIEDYYALGTNCTTLTVQAAKIALPNIDHEASIYNKGRGLGIMEKGLVQMSGWPPHIFMPTDLQKMIEGDSSGKLKRIKTYGSK